MDGEGQKDKGTDRSGEFLQAARGKRASAMAELGRFLMHNKKWWLAPIILILLLLGLLIFLSGSAIGPFLYTFY